MSLPELLKKFSDEQTAKGVSEAKINEVFYFAFPVAIKRTIAELKSNDPDGKIAKEIALINDPKKMFDEDFLRTKAQIAVNSQGESLESVFIRHFASFLEEVS